MPVQSLGTSQLGVTLVHTVAQGLHAGATLKYVRGSVRAAVLEGSDDEDDLLDRGGELSGGETDGAFEADLGLLAVAGPFRAGLLVRNVREVEFAQTAGTARLPRQVRVGMAYDRAASGGAALTVAFDADLRTVTTGTGERRNVAIGIERWVASQRVGLRAGARVNTAGGRERTGTGGISVAVRSGLFLDAHVVRGGRADERGWGLAARVSF